MKTIVIGGSGYTGRHVVDACLRNDHEVTVVGRSQPTNLPKEVIFRYGDASALTHDQWLLTLEGNEALVFAAGVDSRAQVPPPSNAFFQRHNVDAVRRMMSAACEVGITSAVIHGSYNVALHRQRPEMKLLERHPYISSRADQAAQARSVAGSDCSVAVLEIPYVFGRTPGRPNQFEYMIPWLSGTINLPLMAPPGGTAVVSASAIGVATCAALTARLDGDFPVTQANLTWTELVSRLAKLAGHPRPGEIRHLPARLFQRFMQFNGYRDRMRGVDSGLDHKYYSELYTSEMFTPVCLPELGIDDSDLNDALRETVSGTT
ncbi:NAD-dependent epimerase/dehydratase family protein [Lentzea jiangxiensis]|uniref:Nucleoside-diphosphate-sugar epimerase n=1 Tax=Lentzea jiangxiensis TaxID=641025 RepID=A0A1H0WTE3_9PSEU|nr:NAD-dependent epimerase/dehydratase family protein [Lentzea jiangxiensis]SDP93987.1 Nucleoside-diphosphate-sugar epimerase [Lentzea jiangxiensis]